MNIQVNLRATIVVKKQQGYTKVEWENKRKIIAKLTQQDLGQKGVLRILNEEHEFFPTLGMLKKKLHEWGLDRKNKEADIAEAVRHTLARRREGKKTECVIRGRVIDQHEINRYLARKKIRDPEAWVSSFPQSTQSEVEPRTPVASPGPGGDEEQDFDEAIDMTSDRSNIGFVLGGHAVEPEWPTPTSTLRGLAEEDDNNQLVPFFAGLSPINICITQPTMFETLLRLDESQHDFMSHMSSHNTVIDGLVLPQWQSESDGQDLLGIFSNGMWRGRDLVLDARTDTAIPCYQEAFAAVGTLLQHSNGVFLREMYEMILNFQLTEEDDVMPLLLRHMSEASQGASYEARIANWRLIEIMSILINMNPVERVVAVDRLLRRLRDSHLGAGPDSLFEAKSIDKALVRSVFRRKTVNHAIAFLTDQLQDKKTLQETDLYEQCATQVELAQYYRYENAYDEVKRNLRQAWQKAARITDNRGHDDIKVRCARTMALVEAKRGNLQLASHYSHHAVHYANNFLGPQDSLTWLVASELDEVTAKFQALGLQEPQKPSAFGDIF